MRNHELGEGIEVKNKEGEVVGTSVTAARRVSSLLQLRTVRQISLLIFYIIINFYSLT